MLLHVLGSEKHSGKFNSEMSIEQKSGEGLQNISIHSQNNIAQRRLQTQVSAINIADNRGIPAAYNLTKASSQGLYNPRLNKT